jgi:hypothetical protein
MNLSGELLEEVENMAGLFFSVPDIMICLEIPIHQEEEFSEILKYNTGHPLYKAYHKGRLTAETELRQSIKMAALNGSNPAQNAMIHFKEQSSL